jgi:hypothetical protein
LLLTTSCCFLVRLLGGYLFHQVFVCMSVSSSDKGNRKIPQTSVVAYEI